MALLLDGKACGKAIEEELKQEITALQLTPRLVLLLVGDNSESKTYVKMKKNASARVGIEAEIQELPATVTLDALLQDIDALNKDASVHGVLLQLPLPAALQPHEETLLHAIHPNKDVDGLHPAHLVRLMQRPSLVVQDDAATLRLEPCTPAGCIEILTRNGISVAGKDVVVVGRGMLVGSPLALMLQQRNATVTTCHSQTQDLAGKVRRADIVFVGVGQPELVRGDWLKRGAVVVDVGINYVDDASAKRGYKIFGDVAFDEAKAVAAAITPVPGGIGPMTIAMLLTNTVKSAKFVAANKQ